MFIGIGSNLRDLQIGHWSIYFVKLTEVYTMPQSPHILKFRLSLPMLIHKNAND